MYCLDVQLIWQVLPKENVTLKYSLGLKQRTPRRPTFLWDFIDWEKCSADCGPGEQISKPRCVEKIGGLVDDKFCRNISKPDAKVRPCNRAPCIPRWVSTRVFAILRTLTIFMDSLNYVGRSCLQSLTLRYLLRCNEIALHMNFIPRHNNDNAWSSYFIRIQSYI